MRIKKILFLSALFYFDLYTMMYKPSTYKTNQTLPRHARLYAVRVYDVATLNTHIYDPTRSQLRSTAIVQQYFQKKLEEIAGDICEEICEDLKTTRKELKSNTRTAQLLIEQRASEPYSLLGKRRRLMVESILAQLDPEFKNTVVVSSQNISFGTTESQAKQSTYGFALHNLIGIHPFIISKETESLWKHVVGHEAGHVKGLDTIFAAVLQAYRPAINSSLMQRINHFFEIRADLYAHTRGPKWSRYGLDYVSFLYPDGDIPTVATGTHPAMSDRKIIAQMVRTLFEELKKEI